MNVKSSTSTAPGFSGRLGRAVRVVAWLIRGDVERFAQATAYSYYNRLPRQVRPLLPWRLRAAYARGRKRAVPDAAPRRRRLFRKSPRLVLHIGLPKTGTTFLQKHIFSQQRQLQYVGKHGAATTAISDDIKRVFRFASPAAWRDYAAYSARDLEGLASATFASNRRVILCSDENYFTSTTSIVNGAADLDAVRVAEHLRWFRKHFWKDGPLRVMLGLRRQDRWLISNYAEQAFRKELSCQDDFEKKMERILAPGARDPNVPFLDYALLVETVTEVVGQDNVHVVLMEDLEEDPHAALAGIEAFTGQRLASDVRENIGNRENVKTMGDNRWRLNTRPIRSQRLRNKLVERAEYVELTPEMSARILDFCRHGNRRLEGILNRDLSRFGY